MEIKESELEGVYIVEPKIFQDERGFFFESFTERIFNEKTGLDINFIQDNHSKSSKGVLRGLHFQINPKAQSKLVRVIEGEILDVAADIRKGSPNYGKYVSLILSAENKKQLFIPKGFAHGFIVLSEIAEVVYKTDEYYHPESDAGIIFNDSKLDIDWNFAENEIQLSAKDQSLPGLHEAKINFVY